MTRYQILADLIQAYSLASLALSMSAVTLSIAYAVAMEAWRRHRQAS